MRKRTIDWVKRRKFSCTFLLIILIGYLSPQTFSFPVKGAGKKDFSQQSFWYYPWGKSITHKGIDVFSPVGTDVFSSTSGIVVYTGNINMGGNVVYVLGPKWRLHYYAHLSKIETSFFSFVSSGDLIGKVGQTGNAAGKSPHLHYSIRTIIPIPWQADSAKQGWRKMFYVDPTPYLNEVAK